MFRKMIDLSDIREFGMIYERFHKLAFHIAVLILENEEDAKDVVQDVFIALYNSKSHFQSLSNLKSWISIVTKHIASNLLAKRSRESNYIRTEYDFKDAFVYMQDYTLLEFDLALTYEEKMVVVFHLLDGLPFSLIAEIINKSKTTVKTIYLNALKVMKARLYPAKRK